MTGSIVRLNDKGFGFIKPDDGGDRDVFFHARSLNGVMFDELQEGDAVSFDVEDTEKGPNAVNVTRGGAAPAAADEAPAEAANDDEAPAEESAPEAA